MKWKPILVLGFLAMSAVAIVYLEYRQMRFFAGLTTITTEFREELGKLEARLEKNRVLVARKDLGKAELGTQLYDPLEYFEYADVSVEDVPHDYVKDPFRLVDRKIVKEKAKGEVIAESDLWPTLPQGMRVIRLDTFAFNHYSITADPDGVVDLILEPLDKRSPTVTIAKNVRVLALFHALADHVSDRPSLDTIYLAVTPEQASKIHRAVQRGRIYTYCEKYAREKPKEEMPPPPPPPPPSPEATP